MAAASTASADPAFLNRRCPMLFQYSSAASSTASCPQLGRLTSAISMSVVPRRNTRLPYFAHLPNYYELQEKGRLPSLKVDGLENGGQIRVHLRQRRVNVIFSLQTSELSGIYNWHRHRPAFNEFDQGVIDYCGKEYHRTTSPSVILRAEYQSYTQADDEAHRPPALPASEPSKMLQHPTTSDGYYR